MWRVILTIHTEQATCLQQPFEEIHKMYSVLYIEDELDNRILIERFLGFEGFQVYTVETGQEGLEKAGEILPDVFLIDFNLPDINGYEIIKVLNDRNETRNIPKIIFTAHIVQKERAASGGPDFFIQKPVDIDTLAQKLQYAIEHPKDSKKFVL